MCITVYYLVRSALMTRHQQKNQRKHDRPPSKSRFNHVQQHQGGPGQVSMNYLLIVRRSEISFATAVRQYDSQELPSTIKGRFYFCQQPGQVSMNCSLIVQLETI
jgi:hypothetical protein